VYIPEKYLRAKLRATLSKFHTRCPRAQDYCKENVPSLEPQEREAHLASCFFPVQKGQKIEEAATSTPYRAGE